MTSIEILRAVHHPTRRRMVEFLHLHGPSQVGTLARELGEQVGSISHHLRMLERAGVVAHVPELSTDGRTSWWRLELASLEWSVEDFADPAADRAQARAAERLNLDHQLGKLAAGCGSPGGPTPSGGRRLRLRLSRDGDAGELADLRERWCAPSASGRQASTSTTGRTASRCSSSPTASGPGRERPRAATGWSRAGCSSRRLSDAGDALWTVALAWTAVQVASPAMAGLVVAAGAIPRAIVLLLGGVVADRHEARWVMLGVNAVRVAVLVATCGWVVVVGMTVPVLLVAAIAFGVCDALYEPSAATISRQLVTPEQLPAYTGAGQTLTRIGSHVRRGRGRRRGRRLGARRQRGGERVTFAVVVAYLAVALRPRYPLPRTAAEPVLRGVVRGFAHLKDEPTTRTLVLTLSGLNLAVSPALALGVALRVQQEGWGAHTLGVLEALVGLGAAAGSLALLRWRPRHEAVAGFWFLVLQGVGDRLHRGGIGWPRPWSPARSSA